MATFNFTKSQFSSSTQEEWSYESVGIFGKIPAMKGKKVQFTKKNLKGEKCVALQIFPKKYAKLEEAITDDAVESLVCTAPLSKTIRKAIKGGSSYNKVLSYLVTLEIQKNIEDPERYFLFSEKGDGEQLPAFLVEDLSKEKVTYSTLLEF